MGCSVVQWWGHAGPEIAKPATEATKAANAAVLKQLPFNIPLDAKAIYNVYLGFFSANPTDLHPLPPAHAAKRYVEFMGGADVVLSKARKSFDQGEYRWVAQVVNHVVLADPSNQTARNLQADALEQLGYKAESGPWRNFYVAGAKELREGVKKLAAPNTSSNDIIQSMPLDQFFDFLAIRLDGPQRRAR